MRMQEQKSLFIQENEVCIFPLEQLEKGGSADKSYCVYSIEEFAELNETELSQLLDIEHTKIILHDFPRTFCAVASEMIMAVKHLDRIPTDTTHILFILPIHSAFFINNMSNLIETYNWQILATIGTSDDWYNSRFDVVYPNLFYSEEGFSSYLAYTGKEWTGDSYKIISNCINTEFLNYFATCILITYNMIGEQKNKIKIDNRARKSLTPELILKLVSILSDEKIKQIPLHNNIEDYSDNNGASLGSQFLKQLYFTQCQNENKIAWTNYPDAKEEYHTTELKELETLYSIYTRLGIFDTEHFHYKPTLITHALVDGQDFTKERAIEAAKVVYQQAKDKDVDLILDAVFDDGIPLDDVII